MAQQVNLSPEVEKALAARIASFYNDPYGFVMAAYPWGVPLLPDGTTNPLAKKKGPEAWQARFLKALGRHIRANAFWTLNDLFMKVWRSAVASGHGVGKSALVAWLIQFLMSTRRDTRGTVTANTAHQLETKTWPELSKWHNLLINKHWFTWTATSYYFSQYPEDKRKNYMVTASTVSAENTEAFAGLHNESGTVFIIFDEASGIDSKVWEVADGAFTDGEGFMFTFGNPTRPDGQFFECFSNPTLVDMYYLDHVDSRTVSHTNKNALFDILKKYGEDSDEAKIRVLGQFPTRAYNGFIGTDAVHDACMREHYGDNGAALIMSIDVARFGDDESVIGFRHGRDFRSIPQFVFKGLSTTKLARIAAELADRYRPDDIVIENTGPGAGVIDTLRDLHYKVTEVHPGAHSTDPERYYRNRDEWWCKMRDWIYEQGCLPEDQILHKQLTTILYTLDANGTKYKLESKEMMKDRLKEVTGQGSPDRADQLALTFASKAVRRDSHLHSRQVAKRHEAITEYDVHAY